MDTNSTNRKGNQSHRVVQVSCGEGRWSVDPGLFARPELPKDQDDQPRSSNDESQTQALAKECERADDSTCLSRFFRALFGGGFEEEFQEQVTIHYEPRVVAEVSDNDSGRARQLLLRTHRAEWHVDMLLRFCQGATVDALLAPFHGDDPEDKAAPVSAAVSLLATAQYFQSSPFAQQLQAFIVRCCTDSWQARQLRLLPTPEQNQNDNNNSTSSVSGSESMEATAAVPDVIDEEQTCALWECAEALGAEVVQDYCRAQFRRWAQRKLLSRACAGGRARRLQVAFLVDTTGSMGACLGQLRVHVRELVARVARSGLAPWAEWAALSFGDYCDACPVRHLDFTPDGADVSRFVSLLSPAGGGPTPEAYEWALEEARVALAWRTRSRHACALPGREPAPRAPADAHCARLLVVVGDSFPHVPAYTTARLHWKDMVDRLRADGIAVAAVCAAGSAAASVAFLREVARRGEGIFVDLGTTLPAHSRHQYAPLQHSQQGLLPHPHAWDVLAGAVLDCLAECRRNAAAGAGGDTPDRVHALVDRVIGPAPVLNALDAGGPKTFQDYVDAVRNEEWWRYGASSDDTGPAAGVPAPNAPRSDQPVFAYSPLLRIWERVH